MLAVGVLVLLVDRPEVVGSNARLALPDREVSAPEASELLERAKVYAASHYADKIDNAAQRIAERALPSGEDLARRVAKRGRDWATTYYAIVAIMIATAEEHLSSDQASAFIDEYPQDIVAANSELVELSGHFSLELGKLIHEAARKRAAAVRVAAE